WWVLPLLMIFFAGMEAAQLYSVERQASWMDLLRSWSSVVLAWGLFAIGGFFMLNRPAVHDRAGESQLKSGWRK
ncbi:MAG TPA: hypothetical protein PLZ16_15020, partial [Gammaproteobacteria bacterium]|nr:hypothetical protein [Gammaproteobacteria bacterium]